jgi:hypothetical protein
MNILNPPPGSTPIEVPENFRRMVPAKYEVEGYELSNGNKVYTIIKIRHVEAALKAAVFLLPDDQLKSRIIDPMITALEG